jgi:hypothetical protein
MAAKEDAMIHEADRRSVVIASSWRWNWLGQGPDEMAIGLLAAEILREGPLVVDAFLLMSRCNCELII